MWVHRYRDERLSEGIHTDSVATYLNLVHRYCDERLLIRFAHPGLHPAARKNRAHVGDPTESPGLGSAIRERIARR